jgi:hypothetical protein
MNGKERSRSFLLRLCAWSVAAFLMRDVMVEQTNKVEVVCVCVCR